MTILSLKQYSPSKAQIFNFHLSKRGKKLDWRNPIYVSSNHADIASEKDISHLCLETEDGNNYGHNRCNDQSNQNSLGRVHAAKKKSNRIISSHDNFSGCFLSQIWRNYIGIKWHFSQSCLFKFIHNLGYLRFFHLYPDSD